MIHQKQWKCLMGKSELGSRAGNSGTRCPGRQEVLEAGGWVRKPIYEENYSWAGSLWAFLHMLQLAALRVYKGPCTTIIPESSSSGQHAYEAVAKAAQTKAFWRWKHSSWLSWHSVSHPTSSPVWAPRKKENNQSQALLSTGLWLLTKMEKTQWISMPHKHHWDGQCRCLLDRGSTFRGSGAEGWGPSGRWSALTSHCPREDRKGAMPWESCP